MARLRDKPRPDVYWPNTPSQWREPTVDDCTWYATEFAFQAASDNHLSMHPVRDLRNKSIDTVGGTRVSVALSETDRLWPKSENVAYKYGAFSRKEIRRALLDGATIVYGGDYEKLPQHYRRWTNDDTFDHSMASRDLRKDRNGNEFTFLYDPLGGGPQREPYDGEWIKLDDVLRFNWGILSRYWVGIVSNRGELPMKYLNLPSQYRPDRVARVKRGTVVRREPREGASKIRRLWSDQVQRPLLYSTDGGWKCLLWKDDSGEWAWGYVHKDDIIETTSVEVPPVDDGIPEEDPNMAQRIEALRFSLTEVRDIANDALATDTDEEPDMGQA